MNNKIASDHQSPPAAMLEGFDCPAILVSADYKILATNSDYRAAFGDINLDQQPSCYQVSHGYDQPCDKSGEDCPLGAARESGHKERVLHIHQTPNGREHVDVEMLPIHDSAGELVYFVELLRPVPLASGTIKEQELVGKSQAFKHMLAKISRVSSSNATVLLLGASGTGKELAARAIHIASERSTKPMVTLECAGLTESLFESELFGHMKGAFTGAHSNKKGLVELADGGTLFLDELGDIPLPLQVKLLRLLETGTFRPVGSEEVRSSDFRLICATHRNLVELVELGEFRSDLYYRINVFPIRLPSLSERREDIPLIGTRLLLQLTDDKNVEIDQKALELLSKHDYKGNIRELRNILNRAVVLSDEGTINANIILQCLEDELQPASDDFHAIETAEKNQWPSLEENETRYLRELLQVFGGDKQRVAKVLGISLRSLYRKLAV
ncbi:MAG: AAA domain-containing protein [Pseudomonadales bacterium]|nr:AAA domain-containing protein [Pseudomonadales bacterium]